MVVAEEAGAAETSMVVVEEAGAAETSMVVVEEAGAEAQRAVEALWRQLQVSSSSNIHDSPLSFLENSLTSVLSDAQLPGKSLSLCFPPL